MKEKRVIGSEREAGATLGHGRQSKISIHTQLKQLCNEMWFALFVRFTRKLRLGQHQLDD